MRPPPKAVLGAIAVAVAVAVAIMLTSSASGGSITFRGDFAHGVKPWTAVRGGVQCANYETPSTPPRLRGTLRLATVAGVRAGVFNLPTDPNPRVFSLEACEIYPGLQPLGLGITKYYGYMFYVPRGLNIGTGAFWGVVAAQYHFQNIWASPISFELHNDHMTLALQLGACHDASSQHPGCAFNSNADNPSGNPGNLGKQYVIPPGSMAPGWNEVVMGVHWAADASGWIQVSHRHKGGSAWTQTVNITGTPTVQYEVGGSAGGDAIDKIGAYRAASSSPVSVALADDFIGTSFAVVAAALP